MKGMHRHRNPALLVLAAASGCGLLRWVMPAAAADITKVTVLDAKFQQVRTITSQHELAVFDEMWSQRRAAANGTTLTHSYKLDIVRNGRSVRWLYDPAGLTQALTVHKSPTYLLPSADDFNALLDAPIIHRCVGRDSEP